ncbi:keratin, type II cytoskeletal 2 oral-like, partial [Sphaerodactylus townsendi]|uniref:keratin, type II cytoskeletal 2 oral-like n=1 Tax=Sphaerodactylus townsendi TaxID=933632 RepID=UPI0020261D45
ELEEAMSQIKDISIVLGIDNYKTNIDPHRIVEDVRTQYEALAIRSWEELEALTRSKLSEGEAQSAKYGDHLLNDRRIIAELNIQIQKMRSCILSLKSQCLRLEGNVKEVGAQGEATLNDARAKLANLEEALQNLRQDLAHLVKEYQELMNIKLALDIEILTYRELMEGEEISMESPAFAFISRVYSGPKFASANSSAPTTSNVAPQARENSTDRMSHIRGGLESGLSRSQSGGTEGTSGGDFSRSHSNASGEAPKGLRNSSTTSRGTLESSFSSSRSGNFADVENTTRSSISRSHGSESFSQTDIYSNRSGDNLEGGLSRSVSRGTSEGSLSRSQSNRSGGLTDSVFASTPSGGEGVSVVSLSRSHSGTSAFFVEGGLSRSQSNENEELMGSNVVRTNSAEDGGVPVGGLPGGQSRASTGSSEGRLSRSQSGKNETLGSRESEGCVEPTISRTNSAEDGGVPVGGISRSHSEVSRYRSEGSLPRSQSDGAGSESVHGKEEYVELHVSRTSSAEDGGVPVGGIPGSRNEVSRYSPERSIPKLHSGDDAARSNHGKDAYARPAVYRTDSAGDGGASASSISG